MKERIKLLFIVDNLPHTGGAQNQLVLLVKSLDKRLFDIAVCNLSTEQDVLANYLRGEDVRLFTIPQRGFFDPSCFLGLNELILNLNPDIINTFLFTADFYGRFAGTLQGISVIVTSVRNIDLWKKARHLMVDKFFEKHTYHFTANSHAVKDYLISEYKIAESKISVIYNAIDLRRFQRFTKAPIEFASKLGIDMKRKVILTIARFDPQKDHLILINAAKIVLKKRSDVVFVLVGQGECEGAIRDAIREDGLQDNFLLISDTQTPDFFYNISYIGLLTSVHEGFSNFILESMACELPVVCTSVGGNPELVVDGENGFLVPPKAPEKVAEKVLAMLDNPSMVRQLGKAAREKVKAFTLAKMAHEYQELYLSLAGKVEPIDVNEKLRREDFSKKMRTANMGRLILAGLLYYTGLLRIFEFFFTKHLKIFLYHRVQEATITTDVFKMSIPLGTFEKQVEYLRRVYKIISLEQGLRLLREGGRLKDNYLVLTFDDGYSDFYSNAFPVFARHNIPASVFLTVARVEKQDCFWYDRLKHIISAFSVTGPLRVEFPKGNIEFDVDSTADRQWVLRLLYEKCKNWGKPMHDEFLQVLSEKLNVRTNPPEMDRPLTWDEAMTLSRSGVTIGSHGFNHAMLTSAQDLDLEIRTSKEMIEEKLAIAVTNFSYPFGGRGNFDRNVKERVREAGYECALSNIDGINVPGADLFELKRKCISLDVAASPLSAFSPAIFACEVAYVFDLLHKIWQFVRYLAWKYLMFAAVFLITMSLS